MLDWDLQQWLNWIRFQQWLEESFVLGMNNEVKWLGMLHKLITNIAIFSGVNMSARFARGQTKYLDWFHQKIQMIMEQMQSGQSCLRVLCQNQNQVIHYLLYLQTLHQTVIKVKYGYKSGLTFCTANYDLLPSVIGRKPLIILAH